ncbi:hypothetical protein [Agrobacterium pusense]|uniref:hypothetical protein n=1 Tax=Agrobacterium pusense TaxID=648995 RepID=UPI000D1C15BA|nr:hypothetical protein [Agrobacterium pusense]
MTLKIHLTTDWPFERVAKYGRQITAAMKKLVDRYPDEMTLKGLAEDVISGKNQLWLILDDEEFKAFVTSEIKVNEETGRRTLILSELAGDGGLDLVPMIGDIEEWAKDNGISELTPLGREGWRKPLARAGYKPKFVLYSKDLTNG